MNTEIIPIQDAHALPTALQILAQGGVVAFPTDTVYGLGALITLPKAIAQLYSAKERPLEKAIPVLLGSSDDLTHVAAEPPLIARKLAQRFWPGPLTLIVPRLASLPDILGPLPTVGVRVPDHPAAQALLQAAGPLAVTSANRSGAANPRTADDVYSQLGGKIPLILDGGSTPGGSPSTVVDCTTPNLKVLRSGPISLQMLQEALDTT